jgi:hypothetical protein
MENYILAVLFDERINIASDLFYGVIVDIILFAREQGKSPQREVRKRCGRCGELVMRFGVS